MSIKFLRQADVAKLLEELGREYRVLAPVQEGDAVVFRPYDPKRALRLDRPATAPPKEAVFPQTELLMRFTYRKDPEDLSRTDIELVERGLSPRTLVFGSRPCDAGGFVVYDRVYDSPKTQDPYYKARRANTAFVSIVCTQPANTCFCNSVGGGPANPTGSDVLLAPVDDGYVAEAVTERGETVLQAAAFTDPGDKAADAEKIKNEAAAAMPKPIDLDDESGKILARFDDLSFWSEMAAKCISCGACTYLCPTCYCFNITDEASGLSGERLRTWDTCMSYLFTLEGSGHNPRPTKAHRLRNRVGHKFSYYPSLHDGHIACCGCGRCIKSCPVSVDIREIVTKAKELGDG
jgi:sulfhydrogenase subunit beta (sulfur reductase)